MMIRSSNRFNISQGEFTLIWAKIALLSFGGPAGQIALMHKVIVDEKKWITESQFLHALNFCMLLPGPEAQQLATYIGWILKGVRGGLVAGLLFILPGIVTIMALSWLYVLFAETNFLQALFYGLKAAILAIVIEALWRIGKRALKGYAAYSIALLAFIGMYFFHVPFPLIVLLSFIAGFFWMQRPQLNHQEEGVLKISRMVARYTFLAGVTSLVLWILPILALYIYLGPDDIFTQISIFFSKMAVVTFGGAYAVLSYVAQEAVQHLNWLKPEEMLDGLGMAETTPGPLIMVLQYVGFLASYRHADLGNPLLAGTIGGLVTTWVTFAPCFSWIFLGAPYVERLRHKVKVRAALSGVSAAVTGVILNLSIWFALHILFSDIYTISQGLMVFSRPNFSSIQFPALLIFCISATGLLFFKWGMFRILAIAIISAYLMALLGII